jgi:short-subunit dehydrogenase
MRNPEKEKELATTKAFIPHFRTKGTGLFINTTSIGGLMTVPFNSIYHATKWALEGWSESMAFEFESTRHRDEDS